MGVCKTKIVDAILNVEASCGSRTNAPKKSPGRFTRVEIHPMSAKRPAGPACPIVENIANNVLASNTEPKKKERTSAARSKR